MVKIKGYEIAEVKIKNSFLRRAQAFKNSIESNLKKIGIHEDNIDVSFENMPMSRKPAYVSWYFDNNYHYYSFNKSKFVDNLYIINKLISKYSLDILSGEKTMEEFSKDFVEDHGVDEKRVQAREYFGLDEDFTVEQVNKKYKLLSKKVHPDMPTGNTEKFKELNEMHKIIKREFS